MLHYEVGRAFPELGSMHMGKFEAFLPLEQSFTKMKMEMDSAGLL